MSLPALPLPTLFKLAYLNLLYLKNWRWATNGKLRCSWFSIAFGWLCKVFPHSAHSPSFYRNRAKTRGCLLKSPLKLVSLESMRREYTGSPRPLKIISFWNVYLQKMMNIELKWTLLFFRSSRHNWNKHLIKSNSNRTSRMSFSFTKWFWSVLLLFLEMRTFGDFFFSGYLNSQCQKWLNRYCDRKMNKRLLSLLLYWTLCTRFL